MGGGGLKPQGLMRVGRALRPANQLTVSSIIATVRIRYVLAAGVNLSTSMPSARSCARQRS